MDADRRENNNVTDNAKVQHNGVKSLVRRFEMLCVVPIFSSFFHNSVLRAG